MSKYRMSILLNGYRELNLINGLLSISKLLFHAISNNYIFHESIRYDCVLVCCSHP